MTIALSELFFGLIIEVVNLSTKCLYINRMRSGAVDIFNLDNLDDIPDELKGELRIFKGNVFQVRIIELFKKANGELNLDQIQRL